MTNNNELSKIEPVDVRIPPSPQQVKAKRRAGTNTETTLVGPEQAEQEFNKNHTYSYTDGNMVVSIWFNTRTMEWFSKVTITSSIIIPIKLEDIAFYELQREHQKNFILARIKDVVMVTIEKTLIDLLKRFV